MTHHIHVLATPETGHAISQVFQSVDRRYVQCRLWPQRHPLGGALPCDGGGKRAVPAEADAVHLTQSGARRQGDRYRRLSLVELSPPCVGRDGPQRRRVDAASGVFATGAEPAGAGTCLPGTVPNSHGSRRSNRHPGPLALGLGTRQRAV